LIFSLCRQDVVIPVRYYFRNTRDVSCHCEDPGLDPGDEAISAARDCFGLDALAMTTVGNVTFFRANRISSGDLGIWRGTMNLYGLRKLGKDQFEQYCKM
jgi:hypothetical protein